MAAGNFVFKGLLAISVLLLTAHFGFTQEETADFAEKQMVRQLEAVKNGDLEQFKDNGNKAFKDLMDAYTFDSFKLQNGAKLWKGYRLEYLGAVRRIGMRQHLWKVHIEGDKHELLGSLSLSHGKGVGFNLD